jgi:hypothetical protein
MMPAGLGTLFALRLPKKIMFSSLKSSLRFAKFRSKKRAQVAKPKFPAFGISNDEQEARMAASRTQVLKSHHVPVVIPRNLKPNSNEPRLPRVIFPESTPNLGLPVFRHVKFDD